MESIDKIRGTFGRRAEDLPRENVPATVINRLPRYHRYLGDLMHEGKLRISSAELARLMGVTASQVRQDFNCFGGFGQQGYGYNVSYLYGKIRELLGAEEGYRAVIVGAGNLGRALAASHMFERRGVTRVALFDNKPDVIGTTVSGIPVLDVAELGAFCKKERIDVGVLTVPKEAAYDVANVLADAGVKGIWNFANMELSLNRDDVLVQDVHLGDSLMTLCYDIKFKSIQGNKNDG